MSLLREFGASWDAFRAVFVLVIAVPVLLPALFPKRFRL